MNADDIEMLLRLLAALIAGGLIGYERSYHGRPAGFRTHALVCTASSLLMLVTVYEAHWVRAASDMVRLDPTRMAQGIMTGIGFLGAGVIIHEGISVRGLTTAASIWITAAIGILAGIGFYFPMVIATLITLLTLTIFRWIESKVPGEFYAHLEIRFARESLMPEDEFVRFMGDHGFSIANMSYRYNAGASYFEYQMVIRTRDMSNVKKLTQSLSATKSILEFRMFPAGD